MAKQLHVSECILPTVIGVINGNFDIGITCHETIATTLMAIWIRWVSRRTPHSLHPAVPTMRGVSLKNSTDHACEAAGSGFCNVSRSMQTLLHILFFDPSPVFSLADLQVPLGI